MQRALASQPPGVTSVTPQISPKPQKKDIIGPAGEKTHSPQRKPSVTTPSAPAQKQASPVPSQKMSQDAQKARPPCKSPDRTQQADSKQSNATAVTQQESGGLFGFGGGKSAAKPSESVSGKMLGFGSSIFSSASTLITSAVQDQPKTTPPVSPKLSPAREVKATAPQTKEEQKRTEQAQQSKTTPVVQAKVDKAPSQHTKAAGGSDKSTCPLCKVELNMGTKEPPNYNTCTECKNTVCNQCGFNPAPNESQVCETILIIYIHLHFKQCCDTVNVSV